MNRADSQVQQDKALAYICGFAPTNQLASLRLAATQNAMLLFEEPVCGDNAPTLLRQNRFTKLFNPILHFVGVTPGYKEPDGNAVFLLFFSLFFAMLVSDAGYGAIMFLGTWAYKTWAKPKTHQVIPLFFLLSVATLCWGAVTGVWFGAPAALSIPIFSWMTLPFLNSWSADSNQGIIQLSFLIGWCHLSLAHLWRFFTLKPRSQKAAEIGWIGLITGLLALANYFVLRTPIAAWPLPTLFASLIVVTIFSEQKPNQPFYQGLFKGVIGLPLNLLNGVGHFSDLVSYIRLFAVGLATKEMAVTFNHLALNNGFDTALSGVLSVLIFLIGHWINMALAGIAVMVHGIRLNFLEFSKHLNIQWTGRWYRPFIYTK